MIVALDIGKRKTGIAKSPKGTKLALPFKTLFHKKQDAIIEELKKINSEELIEKIIIGLPLSLDGAQTQQTRETKDVGSMIQDVFSGVEVVYIDERMTSLQAGKIEQKKITADEDALAAQIILQQYIDSK